MPIEETTGSYKTVQAAVVDMLRALILAGEIAPGTRLLQNELAARFEISTTPVREALRQLTAEGLLEGDAHRGVSVHGTSPEELEQIYELRLELEPLEVSHTVARATEGDIGRLEALVEAMETEADTAEWLSLNVVFHEVLSEIADRPRVRDILRSLRHLSALYIAGSIHEVPERLATANTEHRALVRAIRDGDVEAAQKTIIEHLRHTLELGDMTVRANGSPADAAQGLTG
jgi:DNA-binding GntR family transcriptional regulator